MNLNPLKAFKSTDPWAPSPEVLSLQIWGERARIYIFYKFPSDVDAAGPGTALSEPLL